MKSTCKKFFITALAAAFALVSVSAGLAQEDADEFMLEEITVTAQKRSENQQKVAIAMDVISSEELQSSGKNNIEEILGDVAGVGITKGSDGLRISLRGVSDDTTAYHGQSGSTPTVAVNVDGVYSNKKNGGYGLFDMERVEVLYGPQSTMYASNSPGGIVNVVTANPKLDTYEAYATVEMGSYSLLHTEGMVNTPVTEKLALRAAFSTQLRDGYLSNGGDNEDAKALRLRGLYQASDALSFVLTGETVRSNNFTYGAVDGFVDEGDVEDPWDTGDRIMGEPTDSTDDKLYGQMNLDLSFGAMTFIPSYAKSDSFGVNVNQKMNPQTGEAGNEYYLNGNSSEEFGAELRMSSNPDSFLTWVAGLNYYNSEQVLDQVTYNDDYEYAGEAKYGTMNEESKAFFANVTYPVSEKLRATAGLRYSWDDIDVLRLETMFDHNSGSSETTPIAYNHSYADPDFKLGMEYDLSESSMLYADFATSYRAQGLAGTGASGKAATITTPPPEKLKALTVGAKNRFMNNRLQMNLSAYYYDYKNYSAAESVTGWTGYLYGQAPEDATNVYSDIDDGASTWGDGYMAGVDLQTTAVLTPNDILDLSISYLKTEWESLYFDYEYEYQDLSGYPSTMPETAITIQALVDKSYNGKPMTASPEWSFNANYKHTFILSNGGTLDAQVTETYKGDYRLTWNDDDYPYNYQEAFFKTDVSISYNDPEGRYTLSAYGRNLEDYAEKMGYYPAPTDETRVASPRTLGAVMTIRFF